MSLKAPEKHKIQRLAKVFFFGCVTCLWAQVTQPRKKTFADLCKGLSQLFTPSLQCMATPFVMTALVWFVVRMYLNDLYISIPDRILVVAAMAQLIQNIPTEVTSQICKWVYISMVARWLWPDF